mmetsp:Transcript_75890/g.203298  ORF Transcript_75890/g.203298 Transcript_75890/m.203298 type:complete len:164 (+) Transcript_75890:142-633(+)
MQPYELELMSLVMIEDSMWLDSMSAGTNDSTSAAPANGIRRSPLSQPFRSTAASQTMSLIERAASFGSILEPSCIAPQNKRPKAQSASSNSDFAPPTSESKTSDNVNNVMAKAAAEVATSDRSLNSRTSRTSKKLKKSDTPDLQKSEGSVEAVGVKRFRPWEH